MEKGILKTKLQNGQTCLGTWVFIPSTAMVEIIALAGFDFIVIDMEHAPISYETAIDMITAAENNGLTPVVRVPFLGSSPILRVLDSGAHGVQVPHVSTRQHALEVVKHCKYKPLGMRGMAPNARAGHYTYRDADKKPYVENEMTLVVVNVEGVEGVENLSGILEVDHIDVIFLGPYDLSQSAGYPGQIDHPKVRALIEKSVALIRKAGKVAGCFALDEEQAKSLINMGVKYITYQADGPIIRDAFERICKTVMSK